MFHYAASRSLVDNKLIVVFAVTHTFFASHTHPACCNGPYPLIVKIVGEENRGNEMIEEVQARNTVKEKGKLELQHGPVSLASLSVAKQIFTTFHSPHVISHTAE